MKRLFHQTKIYDYQKITDADKHIKEMATKGWIAVIKDEIYQECAYKNGQDDFPWSVEYYKKSIKSDGDNVQNFIKTITADTQYFEKMGINVEFVPFIIDAVKYSITD